MNSFPILEGGLSALPNVAGLSGGPAQAQAPSAPLAFEQWPAPQEEVMSCIKATIVAFAMCTVLAACTTPQQRIENKENLLSASGFKFIPANTPARQSALLTLPPHQLIREIKNGQVRYAYADPTICGCLYVGNQAAFGQYQQNVFDKRIANEQAMAANDYAMASWDWGPWGGPWGGFYY